MLQQGFDQASRGRDTVTVTAMVKDKVQVKVQGKVQIKGQGKGGTTCRAGLLGMWFTEGGKSYGLRLGLGLGSGLGLGMVTMVVLVIPLSGGNGD